MKQASSQVILLTAVAMLCFAANSIVCRLALAPGYIDAATFTTLRVISAGAMLCVAVLLSRRQLPRLAHVNLPSAMALLGYLIFFSFAYVRLDAGSGALVLIGAVQITMFGIALFEGERFRPLQWIGLGLALLGFVYLILPGVSAPDPFGTVLMALSGISWGCFSLLARGAPDPIAANASNFLACLFPVGLINLIIGYPFGIRTRRIAARGHLRWNRDRIWLHRLVSCGSRPAGPSCRHRTALAAGACCAWWRGFSVRANHCQAAGRQHGDAGRYCAGAGTTC